MNPVDKQVEKVEESKKRRGVLGSWTDEQLHDVKMWCSLGEEFKNFMWTYLPESIVQDNDKLLRVLSRYQDKCGFGMSVCLKSKGSETQRKDLYFFEQLMMLSESVSVLKLADESVLEKSQWCYEWMSQMSDGFELVGSPLSVMSAHAQGRENLLLRCMRHNQLLVLHSKLKLIQERQWLLQIIEQEGARWYKQMPQHWREDPALVYAWMCQSLDQKSELRLWDRMYPTEEVPSKVWQHWQLDAKTVKRLEQGMGLMKYQTLEQMQEFVDFVKLVSSQMQSQEQKRTLEHQLADESKVFMEQNVGSKGRL